MMEWILSSCVLILVILALRAMLGKRISARLRYALWLVVLIRLLIPVQLFTLPVKTVTVPEETRKAVEETYLMALPTQAYELPERGLPDGVDEMRSQFTEKAVGMPGITYGVVARPYTVTRYAFCMNIPQFLGFLWKLGAVVVLLALWRANSRFWEHLRRIRQPRRELNETVPLPVYKAEDLPSPCLYGIVHPTVYVTPEVLEDETALRHVLAHEMTHYRHGDHIWSLLRCLALAVHWWNPLVWLAVVLSRRDGELACDEGALRKLGDGERSAYGETLLNLVTVKSRPADLLSCATTMTAGKWGLKTRIQEIACKRKALVSATVAVVLIALVAVGCAFGKGETPEEPETTEKPADSSNVQASDRDEWDFLLTLEGEENGHAVVREVYTNDKTLTFDQVRSKYVSSNMSEILSLPDFDIRETYIDGVPLSGVTADDFLKNVGPEDIRHIKRDGVTAEMVAEALNDAVGTAIGRKDRESLTTLSFAAVDEEKGAHEILLSMSPEEDVVTLTYRYEDGSEFTADLTGGKIIQLMRRVRELEKEQPSQPDIQAFLLSIQATDMETDGGEELARLLREAAWNPVSRLYDYEAYNSFMTEDWAKGGRVVPLTDGSVLRLFAGDIAENRVYIVHESADRAPAAFFQSEELCQWVMAGEIEDPDTIDADALLAAITAEKLTELNFETYPNLGADALAAALNGAVGKWKPYDEEVWNEAMGLPHNFAEANTRAPFWMVQTRDSLHSIQLVAASTAENTVFAFLRGSRSSGADAKVQIMIEDETLYWLVRRAWDHPGFFDEAAFEPFKEILSEYLGGVLSYWYDYHAESGDTRCEITNFQKIATFEDIVPGAEVRLYNWDFVFCVKSPELANPTEGQYFDSQCRIAGNNVGQICAVWQDGKVVRSIFLASDYRYEAGDAEQNPNFTEEYKEYIAQCLADPNYI